MGLKLKHLDRYRDLVRENIKQFPAHQRLWGESRDLSESDVFLVCHIKACETLFAEVGANLKVELDVPPTESVWVD